MAPATATARLGRGLFVHHGPDPGALASALADLLAAPLGDPFAFEVVSVPSAGVERWLSQSLAVRLGATSGDGVAAGIDYRGVDELIAGAVDAGAGGADQPWSAARLPWLVLHTMQAARGEDWFGAVARHAWPQDNAGGRAWATAARIAGLFRSYASQRPEMIEAWRAGRDVLAAGSGEIDLPADRLWQPRLYRAVAAIAGAPDPPARLASALAKLRATPEVVDLPERLAVFGPTRLSGDELSVLDALGAHRGVHLFLTTPSPVAWDAIAALGLPARRPRADDESARAVRHPLTARLGRDARELQLRLADTGAVPIAHRGPEPDGATLLSRLQADIRADRPPTQLTLGPGDGSVSVHRSHGADRQVEVLREVVLGLLSDDETLEPRDIVVMCPDIESFAPLISAAFGSADSPSTHPGQRLRIRIADRSLLQLNPLLAVLAEVLKLHAGRAGRSQVLDLCAQPPVARAFGFTEDDLERLAELSADAGVRWGLDAADRARFSMAGFGQNTWQAGLDRMLTGIAMDADGRHFLGTALPLPDVTASDVDLVGRLAEFCARLRDVSAELAGARPAQAWVDTLRGALDRLTAVPPAETWQLAHAYAALHDLVPGGAGAETERTLTAADIAAMLADAFRGRPSRANFRSGGLTACTLTPMRSVPHRVVCLLGMDADQFPRATTSDGDDLLAGEPWIGDRDPRSEDRQLLLDAIAAAQQHLVIVHSGSSERTGERRDPCVPVQEVIDTLTQMIGPDAMRDLVTVEHPLQPFAAANFAIEGPRSFDAAGLRGALAAAAAPREPVKVWSPAGLPAIEPAEVVELADLVSFFAHPARELLRQQAGLSLWTPEDQPPDEMPVELGPLELWRLGDEMLADALTGVDLDHLVAALWRSGSVPPRALGARALSKVRREVAAVGAAARDAIVLPAQSRQVLAGLGARSVFGVVPGVRGSDIVAVTFARLSARHRLTAWLQLLTLTAAEPGTPWRAVAIGKSGERSILGPIPPEQARARLADLVAVRDLGLSEPLPLPLRTSALAAEIARTGRPEGRFELSDSYRRDLDEIWATWYPDVAQLTAAPARAIDVGDADRTPAETDRMRTVARRVWEPLLAAEAT